MSALASGDPKPSTSKALNSGTAISQESDDSDIPSDDSEPEIYPAVKQELEVEFDPLCVKDEPETEDCSVKEDYVEIEVEIFDQNKAVKKEVTSTQNPTSASKNGIKDNNPEHKINIDIKQIPMLSADLELKAGDIKQEPMDQTDPDDVTTQSIPEGSKQHDVKDIKYVNTQDFLDISETVISKQNRANSKQKRARPGTSSKGRDRSQINIFKIHNTESTLLVAQKQFECDICGFKCRRKVYLKGHMNKHSAEKPFRCEICDYKCKSRCNLMAHKRIHTVDKPFKCDICGYECRQKVYLKGHMKKHAAEKPFTCEICDYKCKSQCNLMTHKRIHSGDKPFKCEICDYRSNQPSNLKIHMRTHTEEKPYQCKICNYRSRKLCNLKTHERTHTGEKPYECEICGHKFRDQGNVKRHMRKHTEEKPNKCEVCDFKCREAYYLKRHMRTHTEEKPYKCEVCDHKFKEQYSLRRHMKKHTRKNKILK